MCVYVVMLCVCDVCQRPFKNAHRRGMVIGRRYMSCPRVRGDRNPASSLLHGNEARNHSDHGTLFAFVTLKYVYGILSALYMAKRIAHATRGVYKTVAARTRT